MPAMKMRREGDDVVKKRRRTEEAFNTPLLNVRTLAAESCLGGDVWLARVFSIPSRPRSPPARMRTSPSFRPCSPPAQECAACLRHRGRLTPRMTPRMTPPWHRLVRLHLRRCSGTAVRSPRLAYQAAVLANDLQEDVHHRVKGVVATARDGQATASWQPGRDGRHATRTRT